MIRENSYKIEKKIISEELIEQSTILFGPPGCGKTSYVQNIAKEIAKLTHKDVIFYNIKNTDIKDNSFFKNAAINNVKNLFQQAKEKAKENTVVIFLDEFDGIATRREDQNDPHKKIDDQNTALNTVLLQELEAIAKEKNIIVYAATNCIGSLDDAAIRTGRFANRQFIGKPDIEIRTNIIKSLDVNCSNKEINILLHLTSNQTAADTAKTIAQWLEFKQGRSPNAIEDFASLSIKSQIKRTLAENKKKKLAMENISEQENEEKISILIKEWTESTNELREQEKFNREIFALKNFQNQERFPSLKFNIAGLLTLEKINKSTSEEALDLQREQLLILSEFVKNCDDIQKSQQDHDREMKALKVTHHKDQLAHNKDIVAQYQALTHSLTSWTHDNSDIAKEMKELNASLLAQLLHLRNLSRSLLEMKSSIEFYIKAQYHEKKMVLEELQYLILAPKISGQDEEEIKISKDECKDIIQFIKSNNYLHFKLNDIIICHDKNKKLQYSFALLWSLSYIMKYQGWEDTEKLESLINEKKDLLMKVVEDIATLIKDRNISKDFIESSIGMPLDLLDWTLFTFFERDLPALYNYIKQISTELNTLFKDKVNN